VASEQPMQPINPKDFEEFLQHSAEWQPANWKKAPDSYVKFIQNGELENKEWNDVPMIVRLAFQGWKNYHKEGTAINQLNPTLPEMEQFLKEYPHYGRSFWRNIEEVDGLQIAGKNYLKMLLESPPSNVHFPSGQIAPFLKVAYFNYLNKE
jgi:hypothetical protein